MTSQSSPPPFLVFDPGELDFGFLLVGESKTLPVRIYNRGRSALDVSSMSIIGTGYSIFQADIDRVEPGDWVTAMVRYKPLAASNQDLGTFTLSTSNGEFNIPLTGRVSANKWKPLLIKKQLG